MTDLLEKAGLAFAWVLWQGQPVCGNELILAVRNEGFASFEACSEFAIGLLQFRSGGELVVVL